MKAGRKTRWFQGWKAQGLALAIAGVTAAGVVKAETPQTSPGTAIALMQATAAVDRGDCAAARSPLSQLWNDPYLEQSDPDLASRMRASLIACVAQTEGLKAALARSAENIARPGARIDAYDMHVFLLVIDQQIPAAATALNEAMARFPDTATQLSDLTVLGVLVQLRDTDAAATQALMNRIQDVRWQARNPSMRPLMGLMRLEALRTAVAAGDAAYVASYRSDIARDSLVYVVSQGDGEISDPSAPLIDVGPVISAEISEISAYVGANPTDLTALAYLMILERANGQENLALVQLEGILALVDQYGLQNFQSIDTYPGLLTSRASLLADLGRYIEADAAFKSGVEKLTPQAGVAHALSYIGYLTDNGREADALKLAGTLDMSLMDAAQTTWFTELKACAYAYIGDEPAYARSMALLAEAPLARIKPMLCAGDTDGAAAALIAALTNPDIRQEMIYYMQDGAANFPYGGRDEVLIAAKRALKKRPDVIEAAKAAKINIRTWPLRF